MYIYIYIHTKDSRLAHSDALAQPSFSLAAYESQGVIDSILHAALSGHAHMGPRVWDTIHTHTHTLTSPTARTMAHHPQGRVGRAKFNRGYSVMKVAKVSHHPPQPKGFVGNMCVHIKKHAGKFHKIFLK